MLARQPALVDSAQEVSFRLVQLIIAAIFVGLGRCCLECFNYVARDVVVPCLERFLPPRAMLHIRSAMCSWHIVQAKALML